MIKRVEFTKPKSKEQSIKRSNESSPKGSQQFFPPKRKTEDKKKEKKDSDSDSDCICALSDCSSDCCCYEDGDFLPKRKIDLKLQRRKKKKNVTLFFESSILDFQRIRRINFVNSSSGSSMEDSSVEKVYVKKLEKTKIKKYDLPNEKENKIQEPIFKESKINDLTKSSNRLKTEPAVDLQPQQSKSEIKKTDPQISKTIFSKIPEVKGKIKEPKTVLYREKPKDEEWAKYETPDIVHPQQIRVPKKPKGEPKKTKPKYKKDRKRSKIEKEEAPIQKVKYTAQALPQDQVKELPTSKVKAKKGKDKQQRQDSSSSIYDCYECDSD